MTHNDLISQSVTKYDNLVNQDRWKIQEPNDGTIVALTTQIKNLEKTINVNRNPKLLATGDGSSKNSSTGNRFILDAWRIELIVDIPTWHWYKHHVMVCVYQGMYIILASFIHSSYLQINYHTVVG